MRDVDRAPRLFVVVDAAERLQVRGSKLWMPIDRRLMPAARKSRNFPASNVPGFASSVISASAARCSRARNAASSPSIAAAGSRLGVPPPKKIEYTRRPHTDGSARSRSAISASRVRGRRGRFPDLVRIEVAVGALPHAPGDVHVERERGERGEAELGARGGDVYDGAGHDAPG